MRKGLLPTLAIAASLALGASTAQAQLQLAPVGGTTFTAPRHATSPPGDTGRLFIAESGGSIRLVDTAANTTQAAPFLDISADVCAGPPEPCGAEAGMFSMAFAPDYPTSGRFYVFFTRDVAVTQHELVIREYTRSANPDVADPSTERDVLVIDHPNASNHNGGQLQFGPDGMLYISVGDGGSTPETAQSLTTRLGKLLRIDPDDPPGAAEYSIPTGNPFADGTGPNADEIWAYGLRNPYRFSFDRLTGDLIIGDVGQGTWEEVDLLPNGTVGANLGWRCFEGNQAFTTGGECSPPLTNHTSPVLVYPNPAAGGAAINGGFVVRDTTLPTLLGRYLYADSAGALGNQIRSAALSPSGATGDAPTGLTQAGIVSFGEDACGHIYTAAGNVVSRIQPSTAPPACAPQLAPPNPPGGGQTVTPAGTVERDASGKRKKCKQRPTRKQRKRCREKRRKKR